MGISSNKGIDVYSTKLYDEEPDKFRMSRADFYAFASVIALEISTSKVSNEKERFPGRSQFKFGRADCSSSRTTNANDKFPNSHHGFDLKIKYFRDNFEFSDKETLALLGAHSLGRARLENSGFEGRWTDRLTDRPHPQSPEKLTPQSTLDNQYYAEIDVPWKQLLNNAGNFQWHEPPVQAVNTRKSRNDPNQPTILLNSDFCFKWHFTVNLQNHGFIDCSTNCNRELTDVLPVDRRVHNTCCPRSNIVDEFQLLRTNNEVFIMKFTDVFMKMPNRQFSDDTGKLYSSLNDQSKRKSLNKIDSVEDIINQFEGLVFSK